MIATHALLSNATVLGPFAICAGTWLTLKNISVIQDWPALWDWADAIAAVIGGALIFFIALLNLPNPSAWVERAAYPSATTTLWLVLEFIFVSAWLENESDRNTPSSLEPFAKRVASDIR